MLALPVCLLLFWVCGAGVFGGLIQCLSLSPSLEVPIFFHNNNNNNINIMGYSIILLEVPFVYEVTYVT